MVQERRTDQMKCFEGVAVAVTSPLLTQEASQHQLVRQQMQGIDHRLDTKLSKAYSRFRPTQMLCMLNSVLGDSSLPPQTV